MKRKLWYPGIYPSKNEALSQCSVNVLSHCLPTSVQHLKILVLYCHVFAYKTSVTMQ